MASVQSQKFVAAFQEAFTKGGKLASKDLEQLQSLRRGLSNEREAAAADGILGMLKHDKEFDAFEVAPARKALGVLLGVSTGRLPADLEKVLRNAVPVPNVLVKEYDLSFDLSGRGPTFEARAKITLEKKASGTTVLEAHDDRLTIAKVLVDGREVPFKTKDNRLFVEAPGAKTLDIQYSVKPVDKDDPNAYGLIKDKYSGRMWTLTWPYNTGALFPSNSHPADGVTSKVTVRIPPGEEVIGTGEGTTNTFVTKKEAPAYSVAFYTSNRFAHGPGMCACHGITVTSHGIGNEVPKAVREGYTKAAKDSLEFYAQWLGAYDYGKTLKLVEAEGGLGGMEHTGAVAIMLGAARDPEESREVAAHETAHHWFGDNIRIKHWGDFWMSEGFTNYATYRFLRKNDGEEKFLKLLDGAKAEVTSALRSNPHALSAPEHTDVNEIFDSVPYEMGPWILRMMEVKLGTEKFDALLKGWFVAKRQTAVSTEDFIQFAKEKAGVDFKDFFASWNTITAVPDLRHTTAITGKKVAVDLEVKNHLPKGTQIPLRLEGADGKSKTVMVDPGRAQSFSADFEVKKLSWDPERTVLANIRAA